MDPLPRAPLQFARDLPPLATPNWFAPELLAQGVELEPGDAERLGAFLALLLHANALVNLTAITDEDSAWRRHILDALSLIPVLAELPEAALIADVGSGGGVPAIPLAIAMPGLTFTLIEATGKKADFLRAAVASLALTNVRVVAERAEVVGQDHKSFRESFDAVTARALGPMPVAAELTVPLCKVGGSIVLVKGQKADEELASSAAALKLLGAAHAGTIDTPTGRVVVLEKIARTPRAYPRPAGEPKRKPLA